MEKSKNLLTLAQQLESSGDYESFLQNFSGDVVPPIRAIRAQWRNENGESISTDEEWLWRSNEADLVFVAAQVLFDRFEYRASRSKILWLLRTQPKSSRLFAQSLHLLICIQRMRFGDLHSRVRSLENRLTSISRKHADPFVIALSLYSQANGLFILGHLNQAQSLWIEAVDRFRSIGCTGTYETIHSLYRLGQCARDGDDTALAIHRYEEALELSRRRGLRHVYRKVLKELFYCYFEQGDHREMMAIYDQLNELAKTPIDFLESTIAAGYVQMSLKRWRSARRLFLKSFLMKRQMKVDRRRFDLHFHISYLYAFQNRPKLALRFLPVESDPVYRLRLMKKVLEKQPKPDPNLLNLFEKEANTPDFINYRRFTQSLKISPESLNEQRVMIGPEYNWIQVEKGPRLDLSRKPVLRSIVKLIIRTPDGLTKQSIVKNVFQQEIYDSTEHDLKVYRAVSLLNKAAKTANLIVNIDGLYIWNPNLIICDLNRSRISRDLARKV